ncbi:MAG: hypothetical protein AAF467_24075 [Actinomycetota bacterium]
MAVTSTPRSGLVPPNGPEVIDPIPQDWTLVLVDSAAVGDRPTTSARHLAAQLGAIDAGALRAHHRVIAAAVEELAASAGLRWPWGVDDPTVALLRVLAKLAIDHPDAATAVGADLVRLLATDTE